MLKPMKRVAIKKCSKRKKILPGRKLNPGLACDRRGYSPLYYRGYSFQQISLLLVFNALRSAVERMNSKNSSKLLFLCDLTKSSPNFDVKNQWKGSDQQMQQKEKDSPRPETVPGSRMWQTRILTTILPRIQLSINLSSTRFQCFKICSREGEL